MDFELSDEARELAGLTRALCESGRPLWPALEEAGVLAAVLPKEAGGEGYGLPEQCAVLIELGRHAADVPHLEEIVGAARIIGTAAHQLGVVERALEMTAEYARTRVQFGRPIGAFQAVSQRLADAWIDVEALRLALWQAVCRPEPAEVATAGFWAAEAGHRVLHTAVHVHGGVGLDMDYPLHRYFLAAEANEFSLGGATAQLVTLAEEMLP
ncbi:acyl-CoA dehydrogenase family protein [Actinoplanes flavus]|uniref:Acyl-CoA dehydrogenase family protein n=1 Tax=Actinoplanes flavus TaxID=2820290 RepID=A0ABS3UDG8_9ACTN|nr:acyl-CoA dehydrogenase family protein [Actinoplanes flavus]MBO3736821.1 acyl-CoA dehydrogenase family protein [Actinoplanes flavus]